MTLPIFSPIFVSLLAQDGVSYVRNRDKSKKLYFTSLSISESLFIHLLDILDLPGTLCSKIEIAVTFNYLLC